MEEEHQKQIDEIVQGMKDQTVLIQTNMDTYLQGHSQEIQNLKLNHEKEIHQLKFVDHQNELNTFKEANLSLEEQISSLKIKIKDQDLKL